MDTLEFENSPSGKLVPTIEGAHAFVPNPLPPDLKNSDIAEEFAEASLYIGELRGITSLLPNPHLLINPIQKKEAVASSTIEGTVAPISDLFLLEAGAEKNLSSVKAREVYNYVFALEYGIQRLADLPISLRLMREIHEKLLGRLGPARRPTSPPGEIRTIQNWIGQEGCAIKEARFVPPPPNELMICLGALEKFAHRELDNRNPIHALIDAALIHYQFETIHPFPDGNGRLGRLLIPLFLIEKKILEIPILYLSEYFERNRQEYIDRMLAVSRSGDWVGWIRFFLIGIADRSKATIVRARKLETLQQKYHAILQRDGGSIKLVQLAEGIFANPVITVPQAKKLLNVTYRGAQLNVEKLSKIGLLQEVPGTSYPKFYLAPEILKIVTD